MGRDKKPLDQTCPKCNRPSRFRIKQNRGNKKARYIERTWAIHEDGTECYIDNFVKAKDAPGNIISKFSHTLFVIEQQMKRFPLTELETRRLNMALRCFMLNFTEPQRSTLHRERFLKLFELKEMPLPNDTNQGWNKLIEDFKELEKDRQKLDELRLKWCTTQDISTSDWLWRWDPLFRQIRILYNKYESPRRIARRKMINEKLSKNYWKEDKLYEGKKTTYYTGVETPALT